MNTFDKIERDYKNPPWRGGRYATGELKSRYRGISHELFLVAVLIYGYFLMAASRSTPAQIANSVFLFCVTFCYGVSSQYHRRTWTLAAENIIRRMDHSAIYFVIAGSYTPIATLLLDQYGIAALCIAWTGAIVGLVWCLTKTMQDQESKIGLVLYTLVGASMLPFTHFLYERLPFEIFVCFPLALVFLLSGLIIYSQKLFDFVPDMFGHHEVFHLFIIAAQITTAVLVLFIARNFE